VDVVDIEDENVVVVVVVVVVGVVVKCNEAVSWMTGDTTWVVPWVVVMVDGGPCRGHELIAYDVASVP
jgi:hypothetical protein